MDHLPDISDYGFVFMDTSMIPYKNDVIYGGIRPWPILPTVKEIIQGNLYFTLHFDECSSEKAYGLISVLLVRGTKGNKSEVFSINNAWACQGRYSGT